jgi:thioredoxin-related protein
MRKIIFILFIPILGFLPETFAQASPGVIRWMSISEAEKLSKDHPKKILVDVYTDWCGWCKKLDATTYKDPAIVKFMNENFYAVKLNAESRDQIVFQGQEYQFDPSKRINTVAAMFLNDQGGYPTTTFLDEKLQVISVIPGYLATPMMQNVLHYFAENHYLATDWNSYLSSISTVPKQ